MRRIFAALLASVMLAGVVDARVGIVLPVVNTGAFAGADYVPEPNVALSHDIQMVLQTLDAMGADPASYVLIPQANMNTEWARTGYMRWPNGLAEQLDGIIVPAYPGSYRISANTSVFPNVKWDSLTRVASGGVLVPHLYVLTNAAPLRSTVGAGYLSTTTAAMRCSVGVEEASERVNPSEFRGLYVASDPSIRWLPHTYQSGWKIAMPVPGGTRPLLKLGTFAFNVYREGTGLVDAQWPDSMLFSPSSSDTAVVWDRLWAGLASCPNAKTMTFAEVCGGGLMNDSLSNNGVVAFRNGYNEGDLSVLRFALAHFDSLLGGRLFTRGATTRAVFVAGAASRGLRRWTGGISPGDTSAFYSSCDSLARWGVPVTFGLNVNPDTISAYARDLIKLKSIGSARFTPYITDGVFDTTASLSATGTTRNKTRWVDVFGRWRDRVLVGPGGIGDTSLVSQLTYLRAYTDSITGRQTVRVLCPPYDDWSPGVKTATNRFRAKENSRVYADSTMYAMQLAGFMGVLANGQSRECDLSVSSGAGYTNPRGFIGTQGWYKPQLPGSYSVSGDIATFASGAATERFMVLTHNGTGLGLGKTQQHLFSDSTSGKGDGWVNNVYHELDRANGGFFSRQWANQDEWKDFQSDLSTNMYSAPWIGVVYPYDDAIKPKRGYVAKFYCSDLSGDPSNPARSGLWAIRYLQQSFYATNLAAGRTLVRLGYLDEVRP